MHKPFPQSITFVSEVHRINVISGMIWNGCQSSTYRSILDQIKSTVGSLSVDSV